MSRTIQLLKSAGKAELTGHKAKIVASLSKLGASSKPVEFDSLKKACKSVDAKTLRANVRQLAEDKLVSVKVTKVAA